MAVTVPVEVTPPASSPEISPENVVPLCAGRACEKPELSIEIEEVAGPLPPGNEFERWRRGVGGAGPVYPCRAWP